MRLLTILLLGTVVCKKDKPQVLEPGFHVGRVSEGQFEYPHHNGWLSPSSAASLCEQDPQCGGFTYKGTLLPNRNFQIFFFHLLVNIENDLDSWKWNFYRANKTFIELPGLFLGSEKLEVAEVLEGPGAGRAGEAKARALCEERDDCVGLELPRLTPLTYLDFDTRRAVAGQTTLVKARQVDQETNVDATNSWDDIDRCCPRNGRVDKEKVLREVQDNIQRISCDIPQQEFYEQYVLRREPVILVNCSQGWAAQQRWSLDSLLKLKGGSREWRCDIKGGAVQEGEDKDFLTGSELQEVLRTNGTLRIFDKLARRTHTEARRRKEDLASDHELFEDYSTPGPLRDKDLLRKAGILTDYQWVIVSHRDTGTELHMDPDYTSPWNTVLSGHKWWVLMPPEVLPDAFLCDDDCSKSEEDDISALSWYKHVLPQIRKRPFYGNVVKEFIQGPGETIYMPGHLAHAVMNIDDNLSVTENLFLKDSLEDWVHGVMGGGDLVDENRAGDEERFWKSMYYGQLNSGERALVRGVRDQVEGMVGREPEACQEEEQGEEDDDEEEADEE